MSNNIITALQAWQLLLPPCDHHEWIVFVFYVSFVVWLQLEELHLFLKTVRIQK